MLSKLIPATSLMGFQEYLRNHSLIMIRCRPLRIDGADHYHCLYIKAETGN